MDERIKKEIKILCDKALELALILRASKSRFICSTIREGTPVNDAEGSEMMLQGFEGPQNPKIEDAKVAFTVFGALRKLDDLNSDADLTLEKLMSLPM